MDQWFSGQSAVVTGAAHGIGLGVARLLEALGAHVIALDKDERALDERFADGRYTCVPCDIARDDAAALARGIQQRNGGPVPLLVNNVGIDTPGTFLELDESDFDLTFATNVRGPWFLTQAMARSLVDAEMSGSFVFISSIHDSEVRGHPHYGASKAAVAMLVRELADELGPQGIRVNAVAPGDIRSATNPERSPELEELSGRRVPLGRRGEPDDVARIVAVLLSDEWSGYVNGATVRVDGGLALRKWLPDGSQSPRPRGRLRRPRSHGH